MKRWLKLGVATLLTVGIAASVWVLASSMRPNAKSVAQTHVIFDISDLQPGEIRRVDPNGYPFFVVRPDGKMVAAIQAVEPLVSKVQMPHSRDGDASVYVYAAFAHACVLEHVPKGGELGGPNWAGGFVDPCRGYRYDYAGRFVRTDGFKAKGRPAALPSLRVPAYDLRDGKLEIHMTEPNTRE